MRDFAGKEGYPSARHPGITFETESEDINNVLDAHNAQPRRERGFASAFLVIQLHVTL
jgi:hypothetical protein